MKAVVIGAGVGGLGAALALSRAGHEVTVLERDRTPVPHDPDEAFEWDRRGAPQVRHSHALLARLRNLLRDRYPDVLESLFAAGVTEWPLTTHMPPTIDDTSAKWIRARDTQRAVGVGLRGKHAEGGALPRRRVQPGLPLA